MSLASLAGYASGSDSDKEVEDEETPQSFAEIKGVDSIDYEDELGLVEHVPEFPEAKSLFASLPAPKAVQVDEVEEDLSDLKPVEVQKPTKRQLVLPKLSELQDELDEDQPKPKQKRVKSTVGSGLINMLPPPSSFRVAVGSKTTLTQLKPHTITKKPTPPAPKPIVKKVPKALPVDEEPDDAEPGPSSFFSYDEPKLSDDQLAKLVTAEDLKPREKRPISPEVGPVIESEEADEPLPAVAVESSTELPEEALVQLRGRRNEKIEVFSIDAADFTAEARANIVKNLTVEESRPAPTGSGGLGRGYKSKHHITHLAFMAKARENELKNQWAANRMTKRETQQKYGF